MSLANSILGLLSLGQGRSSSWHVCLAQDMHGSVSSTQMSVVSVQHRQISARVEEQHRAPSFEDLVRPIRGGHPRRSWDILGAERAYAPKRRRPTSFVGVKDTPIRQGIINTDAANLLCRHDLHAAAGLVLRQWLMASLTLEVACP